MPRILYFNPENDLALAANDPHYTPPASALRMATDLQLLPLRWAAPDDFILLRKDPPPTPPVREGSGLREDMFLKVIEPSPLHPHPSALSPHPSSPLPYREGSGVGLFPWGWSPLTVTDFLRAGVPASLLPTPEQMQAFRTLAGRATSASVLRNLRERLTAEGYGDLLTGEAYVCRSLDEARHWHEHFGESMFKQPWSGSGRGLQPAHDGVLTPKNEAWLLRTLRQQGYVMAEPFYRRRLDFALEFWRHADGSVTYEGLSLFMTTAGGVYAGNIVDTEERKLQRLSALLPSPKGEESSSKFQVSGSIPPSSLLGRVVAGLISELSSLPPTFYEGPLGVDMMICQAPQTSPHPSSLRSTSGRFETSKISQLSTLNSQLLTLHPCVEINFRMTMGWLALHINP